jgi:SAM-dependent methyltransferase
LGCGEGQILGALLQAHPEVQGISDSVGLDYDPLALETARRDYPAIRFVEGDFTDPALLQSLGSFDLILLVNALHHVFSDAYDEELGEVDVPTAKIAVQSSFQAIQACLRPGGCLLLFDGLETEGDLERMLEIRFLHQQAQENFQQFAAEYRPFRIRFWPGSQRESCRLSIRDFTRYVTKLIFLGKPLWQRERLESYQYFNRDEFIRLFQTNGLRLTEEQQISVDVSRWQDEIEILTPGQEFPSEHILLVGQKAEDSAR